MTSYPRRLTRAEADPMFREYRRTRDVTLRNRIAEGFMDVVSIVATKVGERLGDRIDRDELIAFGMVGLLGAIDGYDPDNKASFTTYAPLRIRGAIMDEIRKLDHAPRLARSRARLVDRVEATFYAEHGRMPDADELRAATGLDDAKFRRVAADCRVKNVISAATPSVEQNTFARDDTIGDSLEARPEVEPGTMPDADAILREIVLPKYGLRHALLLKMYYGEGLSLARAAEALRVTESRASQMHASTIAALRGQLTVRVAA